MEGKDLKSKVTQAGSSQAKIAELLGVKPQTVNSFMTAKDVRSGTIEKIAKVLNKPVSYFYGEEAPAAGSATVTGNNSAASVGGDATVNTTSEELQERIKLLQELLAEKERTIKILLDRLA